MAVQSSGATATAQGWGHGAAAARGCGWAGPTLQSRRNGLEQRSHSDGAGPAARSNRSTGLRPGGSHVAKPLLRSRAVEPWQWRGAGGVE